MKRSTSLWITVAVVAAVTLLNAATLQRGHNWGGDFSQYIHHARNLAEGKPYQDIGLVPHPEFMLAPSATPPVFPLMLWPVYTLFGMDLVALKAPNVLYWAVAMILLALRLRRELPPGLLPVVIGIVAAMPFCFDLKQSILTDIPFLIFIYGALLLLDGVHWAQLPPGRRLAAAAAAGAVVYLCYGTRHLGMAVLIAALLRDLLKYRTLHRHTLIIAAVAGALMLAQALIIRGEGDYASFLNWRVDQRLHTGVAYARTWARFWNNGHCRACQAVLAVSAAALAVAGYVQSLRRGVTCRELFAAVYLLFLVLWPHFQDRYLLPLFGLLIFYAFRASVDLGARMLRRGIRIRPEWIVAAAVLATYVGWYAAYLPTWQRQRDSGPEAPAGRELWTFIRTRTPEDAVLIFWKPRVLALYAGRRAGPWGLDHDPGPAEQERRNYRQMGARYLVVKTGGTARRTTFINEIRPQLDMVFSNGSFRVYDMGRFLDSPESGPATASTALSKRTGGNAR